MPIAYEIDPARRRVVRHAVGSVSGADLLEAVQVISADPAFDPSFDHLVDLQAATSLDITTTEIRWMAQWNGPAPTARRAYVYRGSAQAMVVRIFQRYALDYGWTVRVFQERGLAEQWLDGRPGS